jgi:hypothetical protein
MTTNVEIASNGQRPTYEPGRQTPPMLGFTLTQSGGLIIRVISMGDEDAGRYQPDTEYWYDNRQPLGGGDLTFSHIVTKGFVESQYDDFVAGAQRSLECRRRVRADAWTKRPYTPDPGYRMFKTRDPDAPEAGWMALLLEQDAQGRLTHVTWYKQVQPENGQAWSVALTAPFTLVAVPGADPTIIAPAPWYRYTQSNGS